VRKPAPTAKQSDAEAKAAFALLERRGYGAAERARLRALTVQAQSVPQVDEDAPRARAAADKAYVENLTPVSGSVEPITGNEACPPDVGRSPA
jgi:hypothetical protein